MLGNESLEVLQWKEVGKGVREWCLEVWECKVVEMLEMGLLEQRVVDGQGKAFLEGLECREVEK